MVKKRECEICGREVYSLTRREIEGVIMYVCSDCRHLGKIPKSDLRRKKQQKSRSQKSSKFQSLYSSSSQSPQRKRGGKHDRPAYSAKSRIANLKVVDDAPKRLLRLRTKEGMTRKEFANDMLIKETYYKRIEKGTTALPVDLAKKIEKKYQIKLVEKEDHDENDDISQYLKKSNKNVESMIYFRKRGEEPEYDQ